MNAVIHFQASCGTILFNGEEFYWHSQSHSSGFTIKRGQTRLTKGSRLHTELTAKLKAAQKARMDTLRAAIDEHGYCSPGHYAAIDNMPKTMEV
jgi:hypothetical protein